MRVMVIVKATTKSEAGAFPSAQLLSDMGKFNEALASAGVLIAGEGLHPSSKGKRVQISAGRRTVIDGPFAEPNELIAGFWLWKVGSLDEALAWLRRCPDPMPGEVSTFELRPLLEADDFGVELTPELRARERDLRTELEHQRHL